MNVQNLNSDIISTLPQDIIENILTLIPIKDAVRTSILSRNWKFCWMSIPRLVFDDKLPTTCTVSNEYELPSAILNVLSQHIGSILEFNVNVGQLEMGSLWDVIIRHLSKRTKVEKLVLQISDKYFYNLPSSFFSLQGLNDLKLKNCDFEPPLTFNGFNRLKRMVFIQVNITSKTLQHFLSNCPQLTKVVLDRFGDKDEFEGRNKFTFVELLQCVPLINSLGISYMYMKYLSAGGMSQKLPASLVHLSNLALDVCFTEQDEISSILCLIRNSPNLKTAILRSIVKLDAAQVPMNILKLQDFSSFKMNCFKTLWMINFSKLAPELEVVKLIMAKSPKLELVRIEISTNVSDDEGHKIIRDFKRPPFTLASPSAKFSLERRKP